MPHLTLEALARLVDEAPGTHEDAHLAACEACREELDALRAQTRALATLPSLMPPPDAWPVLRQRLRSEGVIRGGGRRWPVTAVARIAAALALFLTGGIAGYAARGLDAPGTAATSPVESVAATTSDAASDGLGEFSGTSSGTFSADPRTSASPDGPADGESRMALTEEVERTEEMFAAALDRFMRASGTSAPDPAARLAALDNIVLTTAEALNESPGDPVINSYHLTAVAQRDQLIRQLVADGRPVF